MKLSDCKEHERELRKSYIGSDPFSRLKIIQQRLNNPEGGPNRLILMFSAVEALSRSIAMDIFEEGELSKIEYYEKLKHKKIIQLLDIICCHKKIGGTAKEVFGELDIENIQCAERYRNLLVHECTYLRSGCTNELIETCTNILKQLEGFYLKDPK